MKVLSQTDPSGPNGAKQKSGNYVPGPLGLNSRNSYEFHTNFVRISYELVGNSYEIRANLADSYEIRANVARAFCEFHPNLQIRTKFVRNSYEFRVNSVRISYEFPKFSNFSKKSPKFT